MRHRQSGFKLNRSTSWRRATLFSTARNLLIHQSIRTTKTKAYAVRPLVEKLISLAKANSLAAKRQAYKILCDHKLVSRLFNDIGPRFNNRIGGYTRIFNLGSRRGDSAQLVLMELTEIKKKEPKKHKKEKEPQAKEGVPEVVKEEKQPEEKKTKTEVALKEKPPIAKKPSKKFLGGLRNIFKKERDSL